MFKAGAISAEDELVHQAMSEGQDAFQFGGCWEWNDLLTYDYNGPVGIMPVPQNVEDDYTGKLVGGGSKYFFIDSSENTTDAQRQAAKDFLNYLVYDEAGQSFIVNDCSLVPAYSNITLPVSDPLGESVKAYTDNDALVPNYNYLPDDHFAICGAAFQKYLAGQTDRAGFAAELTAYWATAEVGAH